MKFKYKVYGDRLRPVIPVTLRYKDEFIHYEALVDSGADISIFHAEVGEYFGFNNVGHHRPLEAFGIGGKVALYYTHKIIVEIGGWSYEIEAGFMSDVSGRMVSYGVLGQKGFFNLFKSVKFDFSNSDIDLKRK